MTSFTDNFNRPRVLVTEDDPDNKLVLEYCLKKKFEVHSCDSAETFYDKLAESKFDLFVMDIAIKGQKSGLDLIKEIRSMDDYSKAPIVCVSAHVFPHDKESAFKAGADRFVPRPVTNREFMNEVETTLNLRNLSFQF